MQLAYLAAGVVGFIATTVGIFGGSSAGHDVSAYATWKAGRLETMRTKMAHQEKMEAMKLDHERSMATAKLEHERAIASMQLQPFAVDTEERVPMAAEKGK